ncbi:zinc-ribbon domain-containing protein [Sandaracinobacter sp. RS1-74]|uniref:FxLYD domain-containing protein n=1 Tax=Sandaracinobacteroides sayramensis TaxID=2913411 RepID=UPI001EDAAD62|nr:FxLYD domain-containing protein [Sandaracinobacteroides sayramensis]MCG2841671.1 zinc-ribbon domain-containing protein [Sandaracinobacteroides sayramensis]
MQLSCPTCGARYRIDASNWPTEPGAEPGPGGGPVYRARRARCKVCRTVWNAIPEEELLELDDPLPPEEEPRLGDAAWASLGGWPDPKPLAPPPAPDFTPPLSQPPPVFTPPGFTPPRDPSAPLYAPPSRPAIHFESPPVPIPASAEMRATVRARLPGPAALAGQEEEEEIADDGPPPPPPDEQLWEEEEEESTPRKIWLYALTILVLAATLAYVALATGRFRPEDHGLPPVRVPQIDLSNLQLPTIGIPALSLPRTAPPPLAIEADAVKRKLPDDRIVWEVEGVISNPTKSRLPVPPVEVLLLDSAGRVVGRWTVRPEIRNLAPGGEARFETSTIDPPASAERLRLQLKPAELGRL